MLHVASVMHFHTKLFEVRSWRFGAPGWPTNREWGELCAQYPQGENGDRPSELEKLIERGPIPAGGCGRALDVHERDRLFGCETCEVIALSLF
jgi:hypothetical protein